MYTQFDSLTFEHFYRIHSSSTFNSDYFYNSGFKDFLSSSGREYSIPTGGPSMS